MRLTDSLGNEILWPFITPCPVRCESSGGCEKCRIWPTQASNTRYLPIGTFPFGIKIEEEITQEDEERFYKNVLKTDLF